MPLLSAIHTNDGMQILNNINKSSKSNNQWGEEIPLKGITIREPCGPSSYRLVICCLSHVPTCPLFFSAEKSERGEHPGNCQIVDLRGVAQTMKSLSHRAGSYSNWSHLKDHTSSIMGRSAPCQSTAFSWHERLLSGGYAGLKRTYFWQLQLLMDPEGLGWVRKLIFKQC